VEWGGGIGAREKIGQESQDKAEQRPPSDVGKIALATFDRDQRLIWHLVVFSVSASKPYLNV
jgi:hypothetical protein